jgi:alpha-methylacyl-CoA racemase
VNDLLRGYTILDFSHRLPGPYAAMLLEELGANVIKIEDQKWGDPFLDRFFSEFDQSFVTWYQELNKNKKIERLDFNSSEIKNIITEKLKNCDGFVCSFSEKLKIKLGLDEASLSQIQKPIGGVFLEGSSKMSKSLHDLNALARTNLLQYHLNKNEHSVTAPPFLPVAGLGFGQFAATVILASILRSKDKKQVISNTIFLEDTTSLLFSPFFRGENSSNYKFLHNGRYPCYNLYRLNDQNYLAVATVEEKFWLEFCETFKIQATIEERFDTSEKTVSLISSRISKLNSNEIKELLMNKDICCDLIEMNKTTDLENK